MIVFPVNSRAFQPNRCSSEANSLQLKTNAPILVVLDSYAANCDRSHSKSGLIGINFDLRPFSDVWSNVTVEHGATGR